MVLHADNDDDNDGWRARATNNSRLFSVAVAAIETVSILTAQPFGAPSLTNFTHPRSEPSYMLPLSFE